MVPQRLKIFNARIITPGKIIENGTILVTGETITAVSEQNIEAEGVIEINANGQYVSPGFIDIHVHGGGGHDFMDGSEISIFKNCRTACPIWYNRQCCQQH
jgi:N-acetylglucosamine-6-phosphate deacetylase